MRSYVETPVKTVFKGSISTCLQPGSLCFRVLGLIGVDVPDEVKTPEPGLLGEEDPVDDQNENRPILSSDT